MRVEEQYLPDGASHELITQVLAAPGLLERDLDFHHAQPAMRDVVGYTPESAECRTARDVGVTRSERVACSRSNSIRRMIPISITEMAGKFGIGHIFQCFPDLLFVEHSVSCVRNDVCIYLLLSFQLLTSWPVVRRYTFVMCSQRR